MTPEELERERADLLASIDNTDGPLTDEQVRRVAAVAAADRAAFEADMTIAGRLARDHGDELREMFASSGVSDAEPGSTTVSPVEGGNDVYVISRNRGRVQIGSLPYVVVNARAAAIAVPYAEDLEAKRNRPLEAKAAKKHARQERARALRAAGWSVPYIARELKAHPRTVQRYLAGRETATDRETPG